VYLKFILLLHLQNISLSKLSVKVFRYNNITVVAKYHDIIILYSTGAQHPTKQRRANSHSQRPTLTAQQRQSKPFESKIRYKSLVPVSYTYIHHSTLYIQPHTHTRCQIIIVHTALLSTLILYRVILSRFPVI